MIGKARHHEPANDMKHLLEKLHIEPLHLCSLVRLKNNSILQTDTSSREIWKHSRVPPSSKDSILPFTLHKSTNVHGPSLTITLVIYQSHALHFP